MIDLSSAATFGTSGGAIVISASEDGGKAGNITLGVLNSNGGNITITTGNGTIAIQGAISTGSGASGTVRLQAAGDITESAGGSITAGTLGALTSSGNITLGQSNVVGTSSVAGTFAAQDTDSTAAAIVRQRYDDRPLACRSGAGESNHRVCFPSLR